MKFASVIAAASLLLAVPAAAAPAEPAPTPDQVKACLAQLGPQWTMDWKALTIGAPRPPRNNYEARNLSGLGEPQDRVGYPVHVSYVLNGKWPIEADYFLVRNAAGHWQIPTLCIAP
jgi:hypothetical protein